jgi:hypothetical protein
MEYYFFADFADAFNELSSESLAHLYSVKVLNKPLKTIKKLTRKKLIETLKKERYVSHLYFCTRANVLYQRQSKGITDDMNKLCNPESGHFSRAKLANSTRHKTWILGHTSFNKFGDRLQESNDC